MNMTMTSRSAEENGLSRPLRKMSRNIVSFENLNSWKTSNIDLL